MVAPLSWWPRGSPSSPDGSEDLRVFQFEGIPIEASVTLGAGLLVETTCAISRRFGGVDEPFDSAFVGWVKSPKLSSGHRVSRY